MFNEAENHGNYCKHLYILDAVESRRGIKRARQKRWKGKRRESNDNSKSR